MRNIRDRDIEGDRIFSMEISEVNMAIFSEEFDLWMEITPDQKYLGSSIMFGEYSHMEYIFKEHGIYFSRSFRENCLIETLIFDPYFITK